MNVKWAVIENIVTMCLALGGSAGFYYMSHSRWSFLCLFLLCNLNYTRPPKP